MEKVHLKYVKRVEQILHAKREQLEKNYIFFKNSISKKTKKDDLFAPDFLAVELSHAGKRSVIYIDSIRGSNYHNLPSVSCLVDENNQLTGWFNPGELQELIKDSKGKTRNTIYFLDQKYKLDPEGYKSYQLPVDVILNTIELEKEKKWLAHNYFSKSTYLKPFNQIIVSKQNLNMLAGELGLIHNIIFLFQVILVIISFILLFNYSKNISYSIKKLIKAVQNFRKGNLNYKIRVNTTNEIQTLVKEFELMRQNLVESQQGLEDRIRSRTQELQEAQAQISHQEKMASLGLMAAGIAHEIGNPLTSISSIAQIIKRKNVDVKINEYINDILRHIDRISHIVRELVDFSRPSLNETSYLSINDVIRSAVGIVKYDRRAKQVNFLLKLDEKIPKTELVSDQLLQVFLNILINALDALEGYGDQIKVVSSYNNREIKIDIIDQGCGIPKDRLNKIFEPFYTTKKAGKGTGLGLTISYGIIKRLAGEIKVKSELEKGSTFSIIVPVVKNNKTYSSE